MQNELHVLKTYPNRKLYSLNKAGYINLSDVRNLLKAGSKVQIIDARTLKDVTKEKLASAYGYIMRHHLRSRPIEEVMNLLASTDVILPAKGFKDETINGN